MNGAKYTKRDIVNGLQMRQLSMMGEESRDNPYDKNVWGEMVEVEVDIEVKVKSGKVRKEREEEAIGVGWKWNTNVEELVWTGQRIMGDKRRQLIFSAG